MKHEQLRASILAIRIIANISPALAQALELDERYKSIGIITADSGGVLPGRGNKSR